MEILPEDIEPRDTEPVLPEEQKEIDSDGFDNLMDDVREGIGASVKARLDALKEREVRRLERVRFVEMVYTEARAKNLTEIEDPDGSGETVNLEEWFSKQQRKLADERNEIEEERHDILSALDYLDQR